MKTCETCGHEFFFAKVEGSWYPYEWVETTPYLSIEIVDGLPNVRKHKHTVQFHQCRREWVREFNRRLAEPCSKCNAEPGAYCIAMSGSYPRPNLKTLLHKERGANG